MTTTPDQPSAENTPATEGQQARNQQHQRPPRQQQQRNPGQPRNQHQPQQQQQQQQQQWADISVVIPLYNEEDSLKELNQQLREDMTVNGTVEWAYISSVDWEQGLDADRGRSCLATFTITALALIPATPAGSWT